MLRFKQFIPAGFCLKCQVCCRFPERPTAWQPRLTREEISAFKNRRAFKGNLAKGAIKLKALGSFFCCAFFNRKKNSCKIYRLRPLDCRLYRFILISRQRKIFLAAHLACPFVTENIRSKKFKRHIGYLKRVFAKRDIRAFIKTNPAIIQDYQNYRQASPTSVWRELIPLFSVSHR